MKDIVGFLTLKHSRDKGVTSGEGKTELQSGVAGPGKKSRGVGK